MACIKIHRTVTIALTLFIYVITTGYIYNVRAAAADKTNIVIVTDSGRYTLQVELAMTESEQQHGLMNRKYLPDDAGMLFLFPDSKVRLMWMKNTFIPLDMLFIDENNIIKHMALHAKPHSLDKISSVYPVKAILEVNAGTVKRLGVNIGDSVIYELPATN